MRGCRARPTAHDKIWHAHLVTRMRLPAQPRAAKVPEITALFWVIKILTTGMGEATSDWMAGSSIAFAAGVGLVAFVGALWWQFTHSALRRHHLLVRRHDGRRLRHHDRRRSAQGAGHPLRRHHRRLRDRPRGGLHLWYRSEGTLSIHSIVTRRRETFYWLAVLATFALGTAVGDWTAVSLDLGFFSSGVLFGVAILVPLRRLHLVRPQPGRRLLVRLRPDPPARRLLCRLARQTPQQGRRSRLRRRHRRRHRHHHHRGARRLARLQPHRHPAAPGRRHQRRPRRTGAAASTPPRLPRRSNATLWNCEAKMRSFLPLKSARWRSGVFEMMQVGCAIIRPAPCNPLPAPSFIISFSTSGSAAMRWPCSSELAILGVAMTSKRSSTPTKNSGGTARDLDGAELGAFDLPRIEPSWLAG